MKSSWQRFFEVRSENRNKGISGYSDIDLFDKVDKAQSNYRENYVQPYPSTFFIQ
jgi:hypothetical protein